MSMIRAVAKEKSINNQAPCHFVCRSVVSAWGPGKGERTSIFQVVLATGLDRKLIDRKWTRRYGWDR